jgi:hypothetical protein
MYLDPSVHNTDQSLYDSVPWSRDITGIQPSSCVIDGDMIGRRWMYLIDACCFSGYKDKLHQNGIMEVDMKRKYANQVMVWIQHSYVRSM